jgi:hypothetical protein
MVRFKGDLVTTEVPITRVVVKPKITKGLPSLSSFCAQVIDDEAKENLVPQIQAPRSTQNILGTNTNTTNNNNTNTNNTTKSLSSFPSQAKVGGGFSMFGSFGSGVFGSSGFGSRISFAFKSPQRVVAPISAMEPTRPLFINNVSPVEAKPAKVEEQKVVVRSVPFIDQPKRKFDLLLAAALQLGGIDDKGSWVASAPSQQGKRQRTA